MGLATKAMPLMRFGQNCASLLAKTNKANSAIPILLQSRGMYSVELADPDYKRPAPFPYKDKKYTFWQALFDDYSQRWDANSKIVVVDGPPTGNKDKLCKEIAKLMDLHYIPGPNLDSLYINHYGFDLRQVNHKVHLKFRSFDIHEFLQDPTHINTTKLQFQMNMIRFNQYMDAMNHLFNTGQGVVMNRSIYSDPVFFETLVNMGYSNKNAMDYYYECRSEAMFEFKRPHLIIYLDIPPEKIIENVNARNKPGEKNSPFYTKEALNFLCNNYREKLLKPMEPYTELLIYDWSEGGEAVDVVDDICRLPFPAFSPYNMKKWDDWNFCDEWDGKYTRIMFSAYEDKMREWLDLAKFTVPEIYVEPDDVLRYHAVIKSLPSMQYQEGFNPNMGDNVLWKTKKAGHNQFF